MEGTGNSQRKEKTKKALCCRESLVYVYETYKWVDERKRKKKGWGFFNNKGRKCAAAALIYTNYDERCSLSIEDREIVFQH